MRDNDIDSYAANLHSTITNLASECIPNKIIRIKPTEPSWINAKIKQYIRKRKRAYRKARRTNTELHWMQFKTLRNKTVSLIRDAKKAFHDKTASKLTSGELSAKDWWTGSIESSQHFFFHCPYYQQQRNALLNVVSTYHRPTLDLLLYGESSLSYDVNMVIFENIHRFILNCKRFS